MKDTPSASCILFLVMLFYSPCAQGQDVPGNKEIIQQFLLKTDFTADSTNRVLPAKARRLANKAFKQRFHEGSLRFQKSPPNPIKSGVVDGSSRVIGFYLQRGEEYLFLYEHRGFGDHNHLLYVNTERKVVGFFHYYGGIDHWKDVVLKLQKMSLIDQELLTVSDLEA